MKKVVFIIIAIASLFSASAQNHLTFLGEPIDGTMKQFTQRISNKGLTLVQEVDGVNMFLGSYEGYDNCLVGAVPLDDKDLVYSVLVCVFNFEDWISLQKAYLDIKKKLTKEYGKPTEEEETFSIATHNDIEKFQAVISGQCKYEASFETKLGDIEISIVYMPDLGPMVMIQYTDTGNALK